MNVLPTRIQNDPKSGLLGRALESFRRRFGADAEALSFAPGRVEILGNHTEDNGGFVLSYWFSTRTAARPPASR